MTLVVAALVTVLALVPAAQATTVTVRVEGVDQTLVPRTTVETNATPVGKNPGETCGGDTVLGALHQATGGQWDGTWYGESSGYLVESIKGETHRYPDPEGWNFFVNDHGSTTGPCNVALGHGDEILFFVSRCDFDPSINDCSNQPVFPLDLVDVPTRVERGVPFTVRVVRYDYEGRAAPVSGATVSGGGASATTGADGRATLTLDASGNVALRAQRPGYARSDFASVCVYDPAAGGCDVAPPPSGAGAGRAVLDTRLPVATILGIRDRQRFTPRRAPRLLRGRVEPGAAGLHRVRFRLRRAAVGRCWFYSARAERFRPGRCGATWFHYGLGDRPTWEYLLPARLARGAYVLDVRVMDKWGREVSARVRFTVVEARG